MKSYYIYGQFIALILIQGLSLHIHAQPPPSDTNKVVAVGNGWMLMHRSKIEKLYAGYSAYKEIEKYSIRKDDGWVFIKEPQNSNNNQHSTNDFEITRELKIQLKTKENQNGYKNQYVINEYDEGKVEVYVNGNRVYEHQCKKSYPNGIKNVNPYGTGNGIVRFWCNKKIIMYIYIKRNFYEEFVGSTHYFFPYERPTLQSSGTIDLILPIGLYKIIARDIFGRHAKTGWAEIREGWSTFYRVD